ncbi:MAG TPA: glycosyltransferase, partial [Opitutaceae bacterium]
ARFEDYDRELLAGAPFRKVALDRVSRGLVSTLANLGERALAWLARRALRFGLQSPTSLGPYGALRRLAERNPADLTIVHTELPFCIGVDLIAQGRRVAADFEDWHSRDLLPSARASRPMRLLAETERKLMRSAAYTSAPSEAMAGALQSAYGGPCPVVIPNTFPLQAEPAPLPRKTPPGFLWYSQTVGEGRGLEPFLAAWSLTKAESQVTLLGDIDPTYRDHLSGLVPETKRRWLNFLPLVSPESLPLAIATHDIGLALEPTTPESRFLTTTNKVFQYLNAGAAVVATPTAGQKEVLSRIPGCGIVVNLGDPGALALELDALLANRERLAAMGAASRAGAVHAFCWEKSSALLIATVAAAIPSPLHP